MNMVGIAGLLLNAWVVAVLFFVLGLGFAGLFNLIPEARWQGYSANDRRAALWVMGGIPWLFATAGFLITLFLVYFQGFSLDSYFYHWHHSTFFDLYSWHAVLAAGGGGVSGWILIKGCMQATRNCRLTGYLSLIADKEGVLPTNRPVAFAAGLLVPRIFLSQGLLAMLSKTEQTIIREHEAAHARRYDPAKKWLFGLITLCHPSRLRNLLREEMNLCVEQCADESVIRKGVSAYAVAACVVRVAQYVKQDSDAAAHHELVGFGSSRISGRVHYLLATPHYRSVPRSAIFAGLMLTFILASFQIDLIHHLIEIFLRH
tara:strand:+ start:3193 stop:4143 length:951 start_codon:yes stop_codon:yes gene_type:complete